MVFPYGDLSMNTDSRAVPSRSTVENNCAHEVGRHFGNMLPLPNIKEYGRIGMIGIPKEYGIGIWRNMGGLG